jgi:hypothetical protein
LCKPTLRNLNDWSSWCHRSWRRTRGAGSSGLSGTACLRLGLELTLGQRRECRGLLCPGGERLEHESARQAQHVGGALAKRAMRRFQEVLDPAGATIGLGADDTLERRSGRKITAKGCYRDAVRSSKKPVIRCFGLKWVSMMLVVPVPWSRRGWALPCLAMLARPDDQHGRRRHKTSIPWVRHRMKHVRRWRPGRQLGLVVDGGCAAVSLALACVKHQVVMVSCLRWDAARSHPPGKRCPTPLKGMRQRCWQAWAERADTPWEDVEVVWYGGQRK